MHGAIEAGGRSKGLPEVRGAETRVRTGGEKGPGSAQPVSILSRAPSWKSQSTDSISLSLWIRPRQTEGQAGLTSSCSQQIHPVCLWSPGPPCLPPGPSRVLCGAGEAGRKRVWGRLEKPPCMDSGIWTPAQLLPSQAVWPVGLPQPHWATVLSSTMREQNNNVNSEQEKDNHAIPCSPKF